MLNEGDDDMALLSEKFSVMLRQESTIYHCPDYLSQQSLRNIAPPTNYHSQTSAGSEHTTSVSPLTFRIDQSIRKKICKWSYSVVDRYGIERETVSISLSYLDRLLSRCLHRLDHKIYQLAALTTLYMAVKLYEHRNFKISHFVLLGQGQIQAEHIVAMEQEILRMLGFHVHPPTPLCFVRHLLLLLPPGWCNCSTARDYLSDISLFLTELSVFEYSFVPLKPSSIALACILNAMQILQVPIHVIQQFLKIVQDVTLLHVGTNEVEECRMKLWELYPAPDQQDDANVAERHESESPVCVSKAIDFDQQKK